MHVHYYHLHYYTHKHELIWQILEHVQWCSTCTCVVYLLYVCSFHNQLKTVHLNGKVNRRVDFLIHHLLQYEKDAFFQYKKERQLPPATHKRMKLELNRHHRGLQIPTSSVQVSKSTCSTYICNASPLF